jgi:3-oxoacyl-[acyl-carrier protein] reductase
LKNQSLKGRPAIVTGAGGGIGRGHIFHLAAAGAPVVINDINSEAAEALARDVRGLGGEAITSCDDISTQAGANAVVEACCQAFGSVRILINNAGNIRDRTFLKINEDEFDDVYRVHVKGTLWSAQAAARRMVDQGTGGVIINTTSGAHFGSYGQTAYAAAKGAIASMTYTWAMELAKHGIRVNAIGPLGTTSMSATYKGPNGETAPAIDPALNGPAVVYLASDEARNVSGQIFGTGGNRLSHMIQPHYGKTLVREDGWDIESIATVFQQHMPSQFGAFGILGRPYPFHDGVEPKPEGHKA